LQITYQLTPEDLIAVQRDLIAPDPRAKRRFWTTLLLVPLVATLLALAVAEFELWSNWFVTPLVFSLFWAMFYTQAHRRGPERSVRQWLAAGQNAAILQPRTLTISDAEAVETIGVQTTQVRWGGIAEVVRNDEYMLIVLSPETAFTVPKRVFASADEAEQFYAAAMTYYKQARQVHDALA